MPIKLIAFCLALCPLLLAQNAGKPTADVSDTAIKIVRVKTTPNRIVNLVRPGSSVTIQGDNTLSAIVLSGKSADVASVEQVVHDLDMASGSSTAGKNVELTIYILEGTMKPEGGIPALDATSLAPVYKQLRAVFPLKSYRLLSTSMMRSSQNVSTHVEGTIRSLESDSDPAVPGTYEINCASISASAETPPVIHLDQISFFALLPHLGPKGKDGQPEYPRTRVTINTSVDLREDQKVVIGTSNVEPAGATVFLVVSAKIL